VTFLLNALQLKINASCTVSCAAIVNSNSSAFIINPLIYVNLYSGTGSSTTQTYGISNTNTANFVVGPSIKGGIIYLFGGANSNYGIANNNSFPSIDNVQIFAYINSSGATYGIYSNGGTVQILNLSIGINPNQPESYGIYNTGGATTSIQNTVNSGIYNTGGASTSILNSKLSPGSLNRTIFNDTGTTAKVAGSQIAGTVSGPGISCLYSYKPDLTPLGAGCN